MASPTVQVNNSTGSDTAASGAGPATALTGTAASFSASVVTLDGSPDLSAFSASTWVLWMQTSTGRQFFDLSTADNSAKTVTCVNAPAGTATGRTWAIGGKRATLDHAGTRCFFADAKAGWSLDVQETGTDYSLTSSLVFSVSGTAGSPITIGSTSLNRPIVKSSVNSVALFRPNGQAFLRFDHLQFKSTAATRGHGVYFTGSYSNNILAHDCVFNGLLSGWYGAAVNGDEYAGDPGAIIACEFLNCTGDAVRVAGQAFLAGCDIHDNLAAGIWLGQRGNACSPRIVRCLITKNVLGIGRTDFTNIGVYGTLESSTIAENTSDGCLGMGNPFAVIENSIFWGNGGQSINGQFPCFGYFKNNAYPSGSMVNVPPGSGDVILAADPFVNKAIRDYTPTVASGCLGVGYPGQYPSAALAGVLDIGAIQHAATAPGASSGGRKYVIGRGGLG